MTHGTTVATLQCIDEGNMEHATCSMPAQMVSLPEAQAAQLVLGQLHQLEQAQSCHQQAAL